MTLLTAFTAASAEALAKAGLPGHSFLEFFNRKARKEIAKRRKEVNL